MRGIVGDVFLDVYGHGSVYVVESNAFERTDLKQIAHYNSGTLHHKMDELIARIIYIVDFGLRRCHCQTHIVLIQYIHSI